MSGSQQISREWYAPLEHFTCCGDKIVQRRVALVSTYYDAHYKPVRAVRCYECFAPRCAS